MQERRISPLLLIVIVVAAAGMALVGFFWLGGPTAPTPLPQAPELVVKKSPSKTSNPSKSTSTATAQPTPDAPPAPMTAATEATVSAEQKAREEADIKIGTLLAQNPTVEGARDKLLLLFPSFTPFEKIAAAPHIVNLTGDEQLATMVGFLKNPLTPAEAQETFFNDMLNRAPQVGWPVLVEVIATPKHPLAERAKELLTTIVGQDYGNDVFAWQRGLRDQLKAQGAIEEDAPPPAPATTDAAPAQQ